jgi:hypothetical protein
MQQLVSVLFVPKTDIPELKIRKEIFMRKNENFYAQFLQYTLHDPLQLLP